MKSGIRAQFSMLAHAPPVVGAGEAVDLVPCCRRPRLGALCQGSERRTDDAPAVAREGHLCDRKLPVARVQQPADQLADDAVAERPHHLAKPVWRRCLDRSIERANAWTNLANKLATVADVRLSLKPAKAVDHIVERSLDRGGALQICVV